MVVPTAWTRDAVQIATDVPAAIVAVRTIVTVVAAVDSIAVEAVVRFVTSVGLVATTDFVADVVELEKVEEVEVY